jgi:hypothetical protein
MNTRIDFSNDASFRAFITAIECSMIIVPDTATAALARVRDGVITGEGPSTNGRAHFSRVVDTQDAALCERILLAAGSEGQPVTRGEAEVLLQIDAAAVERDAAGRFDDLFMKAIAHHVLASAGRPVPPRAVALALSTPLADWASPHADTDAEVLAWIAGHARGRKRNGPLMTLAALLLGAAAASMSQTLVSMVDLIA